MKTTFGMPITAALLACLRASLTGAAHGQSATVDANTVAGSSSNVNGVLEPGETVEIDTAWNEHFDRSQTVAGTASSFTGLGRPTYTISDNSADYGTVFTGRPQTATARPVTAI